MINPCVSGSDDVLNQIYNLAAKNLFQNEVMTLSLVLTVQPWFMRLFQAAQALNEKQQEAINASKIEPTKILEILGYCKWIDAEEAVKLVEQDTTQKENTPSVFETHTKSDVEVNDSHSRSDTQKSESIDSDHRKDDEYLLDIHPNEAKYFTNPRTGRKVKKLVCKVPGWGKVFEKKWNFKDHIRMHMGDKPYKCTMCDKSFTQKGNLIKHNRQHQFWDLKSRKVHQCRVCLKKFTEKYNLKVSLG